MELLDEYEAESIKSDISEGELAYIQQELLLNSEDVSDNSLEILSDISDTYNVA